MDSASGLASEALRLRDEGATFQEIGDQLGFSKGKAYHLVRLAQGPSIQYDNRDQGRSLSASEIHDRNHRIVLEKNRGTPVGELAISYGLSSRQIRRVLKTWREGPDQGEVELAESTETRLRELTKGMDEAVAASKSAGSPEERQEAIDYAFRLGRERLKVAADGGMLSKRQLLAGILAGQDAARREERVDLIREVNGQVRTVLEEHAADPQLIERVIDGVMAAGGFADEE